ncbi:MAG: CRISPR-associated helicase Cas3' [Spirochaetaceae bacterium]|jgi:CRISPR-associated endonuclease/helicase Cas3|nr:CRISPR-associated helicase Cas3' [Spirochaetaceae bacterium]
MDKKKENTGFGFEGIAHPRQLADGSWDEPQSLEAHAEGTARLAAEFAGAFDSAEWGWLLGILHDLGKEKPEWQRYIRDKSGYNEDALCESERAPARCEHSIDGAKFAEELFGKYAGRILSYCIAGHHTGLPDWYKAAGAHGQRALNCRLENAAACTIPEAVKQALRKLPPPKTFPWSFDRKGLDAALWIRMLFSCLVDADRLDTERYMQPEKHLQRQGYASIGELHAQFDVYMHKKINASSPVNKKLHEARQRVLSDCRAAAKEAGGFFSLSVPTGGGKTLSSMAFALDHAMAHNKKRIIYVIPYTSIIEQNAGVFADVFGSEQILEHHSSIDFDDSKERAKLAVENWDAPIIVTTTVQFYETLFAARTLRCRKLHNIANSVVILDEAHLIPIQYIKPILAALHLLTVHYKTSVVVCTATQPVFEKQDSFPEFPGLPQGALREIITDRDELYQSLQRVKLETPKDSEPTEWQDLAQELAALPRVLCIVSDRKSCRELHALMPAGTYHLSALMCAEHRSEIIKRIKDELQTDANVRVISTQLVEAGVDIDFPVVYRAMAGLDSIAQAAGRCNREGKLGEGGRVVIFYPPRKAPAGELRKAAETAKSMLERGAVSMNDYHVFTKYFSEVYWKAASFDKKGIMDALKLDGNDLTMQFREASDNFKIIDNQNSYAILVPYKKGAEYIEALKKIGLPEWNLLRKLQRYTINIYEREFIHLREQGSLEEILPGVFALNNTVEYCEKTGLALDETAFLPEIYST